MTVNRQQLKEAFWTDIIPVWLFLAGLAIAGALWRLGPWEETALYASGLLELGGLVLVALELWDLPKAWDEPTPGEKVAKWLQKVRSAFSPRSVTVHVQAGELGLSGGEVRATVSLRGDAGLEEQVAFLRKEIGRLDSRADRLEERVKKERKERQEGQDQLRTDVEAAHKELQRAAKAATIGDLHRAWIGLGWLFAGILLGLA